jgi:hypothetical protein
MLFTFAPRTPALTLMHAVGRLFPRGDRAPAIEPIAERGCLRALMRENQGLAAWRIGRTHRVASGFYKSQAWRRHSVMNRAISRPRSRNLDENRHAVPAVRRRGDAELPLGRLLRLSLFQVSVGMAMVLLIGTLNRVMIVELGVPAWLVALMLSLPLVFAPFRALIGFRSDNHRSVLGWRRVPYIWMGTLLQFGGLAIMPFALLILSGDTTGPIWIGQVGRRWRSCWWAPACTPRRRRASRWRPTWRRSARGRGGRAAVRDAAVGMVASGLAFGLLLANFSEVRLIQVVQGAAVVTMALNSQSRCGSRSARSDRGLQHAGHRARALRRRDLCTCRSARPRR